MFTKGVRSAFNARILKKGRTLKMTKTTLIEAVASKANLKKADAEKAVNAVIDVITEALIAGDKVQVTGFGTFEVKATAARAGVNPKTGEKITIKAAKAAKFSAGKTLKDAVNA